MYIPAISSGKLPRIRLALIVLIVMVNLEVKTLTGRRKSSAQQFHRIDRDRALAAKDLALVHDAVMRHAREMVERYGSKVKYWQVMNDWHPTQFSPDKIDPRRRLPC